MSFPRPLHVVIVATALGLGATACNFFLPWEGLWQGTLRSCGANTSLEGKATDLTLVQGTDGKPTGTFTILASESAALVADVKDISINGARIKGSGTFRFTQTDGTVSSQDFTLDLTQTNQDVAGDFTTQGTGGGTCTLKATLQ